MRSSVSLGKTRTYTYLHTNHTAGMIDVKKCNWGYWRSFQDNSRTFQNQISIVFAAWTRTRIEPNICRWEFSAWNPEIFRMKSFDSHPTSVNCPQPSGGQHFESQHYQTITCIITCCMSWELQPKQSPPYIKCCGWLQQDKNVTNNDNLSWALPMVWSVLTLHFECWCKSDPFQEQHSSN